MDESRTKKNLIKIFLTKNPKKNKLPIKEIKTPTTNEYNPNKNKNILEVNAPKLPKKLVISPNDWNLPRPGSSGLCVPTLIRINNPDIINNSPVETFNRNNLNPPYLNIIIVSNTFRIR